MGMPELGLSMNMAPGDLVYQDDNTLVHGRKAAPADCGQVKTGICRM
jgi:hypothetical protein